MKVKNFFGGLGGLVCYLGGCGLGGLVSYWIRRGRAAWVAWY